MVKSIEDGKFKFAALKELNLKIQLFNMFQES